MSLTTPLKFDGRRSKQPGNWVASTKYTPRYRDRSALFARLFADAQHLASLPETAYTGMTDEQITEGLNERLDELKQPVWYGHLDKDKPKRAITDAQRAALAAGRNKC